MSAEIVKEVLSSNLNDLEPKLTRYGYNARILSEQLQARPHDVKAFLRGNLASEARTKDFQEQIKRFGIA